MNLHSKARACSAILIGALAFCSAACGSEDNGYTGNYSNQSSNNPGILNQSLATRYLGTGALSNGQTGDLVLNVDSQGTASGTFRVVNPPVNALADVSVSEGSYPVSGTADVHTGVFSLAGNLPAVGNFSLAGLLPTGDIPGQYVVSLNGQGFSGVVRTANLDTVPPGTESHTRLVMGGTVVNFGFVPNGYNGVNPPLGNNPVFGGIYTTGSSNSNTLLISLTQPGTAPGNYRLLNFGVNTHGQPIKLGTYPLVTNPNANGAFLNLTDTTGQNLNAAWAPSANSSGSITLNIITSTQADVAYNFQNVGPNPRSPGSAQGSFNITGQVRVTFGP